VGKHALLMVSSTIFIALLNYALNIILGWTLPVEEYGRVGVSQTLIFICVWFVSAGFPLVVTGAIARARSRRTDPSGGEAAQQAWRTFKSAWLAGSVLSLAVVALLVGAFYTGVLPLEPVYAPLIAMVAITVGSLGIGSVPSAALQGLFRFGQLAGVKVLEAVVNIVVSVALVVLGLGAAGALGGFALSAALAGVVSVWLLRDQRFWRVRGWGDLSALRQAIPMTFAVFGGVLLTNIDVLAIKFLTPSLQSDALSGAYQVAAVLARAPLFVGTALVSTFYPRLAQDAHDGALTGRPSARELLRWIMLGVLPINMIIAVAAPAVVLFFFPGHYASSASLLVVLAAGSGFLVVASGLAAILQAERRAGVPALVMTVAVSLEIVSLLVLVPAFGPMAAAASAALMSALACTLLLWYCRRMDIAPRGLWRHALSLAWLGALVAPLAVFGGEWGRVPVALWVSAAGLLYAGMVLALNLVSAGEVAWQIPRNMGGALGAAARRAVGVAAWLNRIGPRL
jgi:O-antigen/teichoic acid export membrane protein